MKTRLLYRSCLLAVLSAFCFSLSTVPAEAVPVEYRFVGTGVFGDVNGAEFNNAGFNVSIAGDTDNIVSSPFGHYIPALNGTMTVFGGDLVTTYSGTFVDPLYVFVDNQARIVGFGDDAALTDLIDLYVPDEKLDYYNLTWTFGQIAAGIDYPGTTLLNYFFAPMSFGDLTLDNVDNSGFDAKSAVPEPGTILFLVPSLFAMVGLRRKLTT